MPRIMPVSQRRAITDLAQSEIRLTSLHTNQQAIVEHQPISGIMCTPMTVWADPGYKSRVVGTSVAQATNMVRF